MFEYKNDKLYWKGTDREAVTEIRHGRWYTRLPNKSIRPTANIVYELLTGKYCRFLTFLNGNELDYSIGNLCEKASVPTQEWLRKLFVYDPSGFLVRNGEPAGYLDPTTGYLKYSLKGRTYGMHQLIWLYHFGVIPKELDHKNRDRQDNRIENLRIADRELQRLNSSGWSTKGLPKGVYKGKRGGFQVRITWRGVCKSYGTFETLEEATKISKEVYQRRLSINDTQ